MSDINTISNEIKELKINLENNKDMNKTKDIVSDLLVYFIIIIVKNIKFFIITTILY